MKAEVEQLVTAREGRWFRNQDDVDRAVRVEAAEYEADERNFDQVTWLLAGLDALESDEVVQIEMMQKPHRMRGMDELQDLAESVLESALERGYSADAIARTRAWLGQSRYLLWVRAREFERGLIDEVRTYLSDFAAGTASDMNDFGPDLWRRMMRNWLEDQKAGKDRILGK